MGVVGHFVCEVANWASRLGCPPAKAPGHAARFCPLEPFSVAARAVLEDALARLEAKIESIKLWIALLQLIHHAQ